MVVVSLEQELTDYCKFHFESYVLFQLLRPNAEWVGGNYKNIDEYFKQNEHKKLNNKLALIKYFNRRK